MSNDTDNKTHVDDTAHSDILELTRVAYTAEDYFTARENFLNATYRAEMRRHTIDYLLIAAALIVGIVVIVGALNQTVPVPVLWVLLLIDIAIIAVVTPRIFRKK